MNPLAAVFGIAGKAFGAYQGRKAAAEAGARALEEKSLELAAAKMTAKAALKIAKLERKAAAVSNALNADSNYDLQALKNRAGTWIDEMLIILFCLVFLAPFIGSAIYLVSCAFDACVDFQLERAVAAGWQAHGYARAPWWFEFAMVGILVSTLGLMRFFKLFIDTFKARFGRAKP